MTMQLERQRDDEKQVVEIRQLVMEARGITNQIGNRLEGLFGGKEGSRNYFHWHLIHEARVMTEMMNCLELNVEAWLEDIDDKLKRA